MDNNTTSKGKMQVPDALRHMAAIADEMIASGIRIIKASTDSMGLSILFSAPDDAFKRWAKHRELDVVVEPHDPDDTGLTWYLYTTVSGVLVETYLSDEEKEAWDAE